MEQDSLLAETEGPALDDLFPKREANQQCKDKMDYKLKKQAMYTPLTITHSSR
jgi:hypothetical protein